MSNAQDPFRADARGPTSPPGHGLLRSAPLMPLVDLGFLLVCFLLLAQNGSSFASSIENHLPRDSH